MDDIVILPLFPSLVSGSAVEMDGGDDGDGDGPAVEWSPSLHALSMEGHNKSSCELDRCGPALMRGLRVVRKHGLCIAVIMRW